MKTFKDLVFEPHKMAQIFGSDHIHATIEFTDGSSVSVIQGSNFYSGKGTYEVMSNRFARPDSVKGHMTPKQITAHLRYIQAHPKK